MKYKNYNKELKHPYVIYADFETLSVKNTTSSSVIATLPVCSYGYVAVDWNGKVVHSDFARGEKMGQAFLESIIECAKKLNESVTAARKPLQMTPMDENAFKKAKDCHICGEGLTNKDKVRDHDHLTGVFRGAAHYQCNFAYSLPTVIPVMFHNLKNFDGHIIFNALDENTGKGINIIPHTIEKYIGFKLQSFVFLDSFSFLPSSLENLAENLTSLEKLRFINQLFESHGDLLLKKGFLPYEYIDSLDKFNDDSLPPIDAFYSSLKNTTIPTSLYDHLKIIWNALNCQTLGEFHDVYLKTDVLLLAAVFENFRETSLKNFRIDPCHYFSVPGLSWNAALKLTKVKMDLITDVDMLTMVERGIRGGLSVVSKRYCKANNPNVADYDPTSEQNHIVYLDVNNLYGYAMSKPLPLGDFEWIDLTDVTLQQLLEECKENGKLMILEVDLIYPKKIHSEHNDYPLAPHKLKIDPKMFSAYQKGLLLRLQSTGIEYKSNEKLISSFLKREKYVIHSELLKYYMDQGLVCSKVHRAFKFSQQAWLKPYVDFCTLKRQSSTNSFDKDFWKLMVNSIYGKTIEDKRKHKHVYLIFRGDLALKRFRLELCQRMLILGEGKMLFELRRAKAKMDKPVAVGFTVLELAKQKMFEIHFDHFKPYYGDDIELLYTDTDSLIYNIKTTHLMRDLRFFSHLMDFSNYPKSHPLYDTTHEKIIGYSKDEMGGKSIHEFIALKPKLYATKTDEGQKKRAKGILRVTVRNKVSFEQFMACLNSEIIPREDQLRIGSQSHEIRLIRNNKIIMTPFDDKRFLLDDAISSYAFGHFLNFFAHYVCFDFISQMFTSFH